MLVIVIKGGGLRYIKNNFNFAINFIALAAKLVTNLPVWTWTLTKSNGYHR